MTRLVGVDYSTTSPGLAIYDAGNWATYTVKSAGTKAEPDRDFYARMALLNDRVLNILQPRPTDVIAMESTFQGKSGSEARLHYAWHRFREALADGWGCSVSYLIPPSQVKILATGHGGRATGKAEMLAAARDRLGLDLGKRDDEADAAFIAVGASILTGNPVIDLPSAHMPKAWTKAGIVPAGMGK